MTLRNTPPPAATAVPGPLRRAWGSAADAPALQRSLRPATSALPVAPVADRGTWQVGEPGEGADEATVQAITQRARLEFGTSWPQPTASAFARYWRDGDRVGYETAVFARQHRLTRAVLTALVTGETAWLDEVVDGVVLLCEQSTWCWPAHDDTRTTHGSVLPTVTSPYLDLGAGEVAAQLAWTVHVLGSALEDRAPGLLARIRHEVSTRVLGPYLRRRDWHWLGLSGDVHNWNPWILGNVATTALVLVDDPAVRADVVARTIVDVDRYAASLPADGAIDEGFGYWWNGASRLLELLEVLARATRGALQIEGIQPLTEVVSFPHRTHLGGSWFLNVADSSARPGDLPWEVLHRWGRRLDIPGARRLAASHRVPRRPAATEAPGLGRLLRAVTDGVWCRSAQETALLERDVWLSSTQVVLARAAAGDNRIVLAVKGGHNGEHHNHNDVGSVVVAADGVPLLVDPGRATYTAATFGPDRYTGWPLRSGWHNVPVVRGREQEPGAEHGASDVTVRADDEAAWIGLELSGAYPDADLETWRREVTLHRAGRRVRVVDSWRVRPGARNLPGQTRLHWILAGDVRSLESGRAEVVGLHGAAATLTWDASAAVVGLEDRVLDDPLLIDVWGPRLRRLVFELPDGGPVGEFALEVTAG